MRLTCVCYISYRAEGRLLAARSFKIQVLWCEGVIPALSCQVRKAVKPHRRERGAYQTRQLLDVTSS